MMHAPMNDTMRALVTHTIHFVLKYQDLVLVSVYYFTDISRL